MLLSIYFMLTTTNTSHCVVIGRFGSYRKKAWSRKKQPLTIGPQEFWAYLQPLPGINKVMYIFFQVPSYLLSTLEMIYDLSGQT